MYNITNVISCRQDEIGWRDSDDPCDKALSASVTTSNTGVVFNDFHPLLTFQNLKTIAPNSDAFLHPLYENATTYAIGAIVKVVIGKNNCFFESRVNSNQGNQPETSPTEWLELDFLSDFLREKTDHATQQLFNEVVLKKKENHKTKSIIQDQKLFSSAGRLNDTITSDGSFVGYEIMIERAENLILLINQIGLQLTAVQPGLTIHLFHSSRLDSIATSNYTAGSTARTMEWQATTFELPYVLEDLSINTTTQDSGGRFYIGYFQDDLVGEAINKNFDFENCGGCGAWNITTLVTVRSFLSIRSIKVLPMDLNGIQLWDIGQTNFSQDRNWGINLKLTINCDWSQFLCSNKSIFTNAVGRAVSVQMLKEIAFSVRDNGLDDRIKKEAMFALEGDAEIMGEKKKLEQEVNALNFDLSDFGSPCAPCESRKGVRYEAA